MELFFRDYRAADLESMYRLDVECFEPVFRFTREAMRAFAEAAEAVTVLAESGGGLAGFAIAEVADGAGYVVTVDVAQGWRGRGLGSRLMTELEAKARSAGAQSLMLHVFAGNQAAMAMYENLKYRRLARAAGFYGKGLDAWLYEKKLDRVT